MEIEQTARQFETNAHDNFPMAENAAYQCQGPRHICDTPDACIEHV